MFFHQFYCHIFIFQISTTINFTLSTLHFSLYGRSGSAVGLSAISFSAALQKDAASIPNAFGATNS